jgi:hypothetical protein
VELAGAADTRLRVTETAERNDSLLFGPAIASSSSLDLGVLVRAIDGAELERLARRERAKRAHVIAGNGCQLCSLQFLIVKRARSRSSPGIDPLAASGRGAPATCRPPLFNLH